MKISRTAYLLLFLGSIYPVYMSDSETPEDLEGSGYVLDSYGSGSGEQQEEDEMKSTKGHSNSIDVRKYAAGSENDFHGSSVLTSEGKQWLTEDGGQGFVIVANSKSLLERKEVLVGVIAGGVIGMMFAAAAAAVIIYKLQKKDDEGYIQGQQTDSEIYHGADSEPVFV